LAEAAGVVARRGMPILDSRPATASRPFMRAIGSRAVDEREGCRGHQC
jgi:hypothetical protein